MSDRHIECDPRKGWRIVRPSENGWSHCAFWTQPEDLSPQDTVLTGETGETIREAARRMKRAESVQEWKQDNPGLYEQIAAIAQRDWDTSATRREVELAQKPKPIIAVDFDGTLCENEWPGIGAAKQQTIDVLRTARACGARLILWTNRVGARLNEAVAWSREHGLEFDAVNENLPEVLAAFTTDCRKVYADIYLDDRAAQPCGPVLEQLWTRARAEVLTEEQLDGVKIIPKDESSGEPNNQPTRRSKR